MIEPSLLAQFPVASPMGPFAPAPGTSSVRQFLSLINRERRLAGLGELKLDTNLSRVAMAHSRDMAEHGFFDHRSPRTGTLVDRLGKAGIGYTRAGENIALADTVEKASELLFNSPSHRANLLNPEFTHIGLGLIRNSKGNLVVTQVFTLPAGAVEDPITEEGLLKGINTMRTRGGLLPLIRDPRLQQAASASSRRLAATGLFDFGHLQSQLDIQQAAFDRIQAHLFLSPENKTVLASQGLELPALRGLGLGVAQSSSENPPAPTAIALLLGLQDLG